MTKLSDTQAIILSAAAQRPEHIALPLPESLRGGAAAKVIGAMLAKGLLEEVEADMRKADRQAAVDRQQLEAAQAARQQQPRTGN